MSHFVIYAARLQDAGINHLSIQLGTAKDRTRTMRVEPGVASAPPGAVDFPARTFDLCGTDRVLEALEDDMAFSEDGPTAEKLQAAIAAHPHLRDDLSAWFINWSSVERATDEEVAEAADQISDASIERTTQWVKGLLRGLDIARTRESAKVAADTEKPRATP